MAWACVAALGLGALGSALVLGPGSSYLRLTMDGFEHKQLWRAEAIRWSDVEPFEVRRLKFFGVQTQRLVVWDWVAGYAHRSATRTGGGPPQLCGLSADAIADLLNEWRERAVGGRNPGSGKPGPSPR